MAFLSKFGNILKQTPSKQINGQVYLPSPWLFQAIRCKVSTTSDLFVGGLAYSMDVDNVREVFNKFGQVVQVRIIVDRETGRSRGFGFVSFYYGESSRRAIKALNGRVLHGRVLKLEYATNRNSGDPEFLREFCDEMLKRDGKKSRRVPPPVFISSSQKGVEE